MELLQNKWKGAQQSAIIIIISRLYALPFGCMAVNNLKSNKTLLQYVVSRKAKPLHVQRYLGSYQVLRKLEFGKLKLMN